MDGQHPPAWGSFAIFFFTRHDPRAHLANCTARDGIKKSRMYIIKIMVPRAAPLG
jgi:hypothetical protein